MMKTKYQELRAIIKLLLQRDDAHDALRATALANHVQTVDDGTLEAWIDYDYGMTPDELLERIREALRQ